MSDLSCHCSLISPFSASERVGGEADFSPGSVVCGRQDAGKRAELSLSISPEQVTQQGPCLFFRGLLERFSFEVLKEDVH